MKVCTARLFWVDLLLQLIDGFAGAGHFSFGLGKSRLAGLQPSSAARPPGS
jgi:hypothetical protein